jgi:flagellar hook protein FlgE
MTAINGGSTSGTIGIALNPPAGPGSLVLTAKNDNDLDTIQVGGTAASTLGFGTGNLSFSPVNLLTQNAASEGQTLTVTVGSGTTQTVTFGTGAGEVATLAELQTKLSGLTGLGTATVVQSGTGTGDITLQATSPSASLTVGGTASAAKFGIENLTALPANGTVIANDSSAFDSQSISGGSITAYDSEGNPVNVSFRWAQTSSSGGTSSWQLFYESNTAATGTESQWTNTGTTFNFNSSGEMSPAISGLTLANLSVNGDSLGNVQLQFGNNGLTQFANTSGTTQVSQLQQNGFASGELQSISVDTQNRVVGTFSNGQTIALAQVTLATFNGANSLQALSGQAYAATPESGQPNYSATGTIEGSSLEGSNVDIATQFSQLIVAQQAYSANARVMTTSDQMIQSLLQVIQ